MQQRYFDKYRNSDIYDFLENPSDCFEEKTFICDFCFASATKFLEKSAKLTSCPSCGTLINFSNSKNYKTNYETLPYSGQNPNNNRVNSIRQSNPFIREVKETNKTRQTNKMFSIAFPNENFNVNSPNAMNADNNFIERDDDLENVNLDRLIEELLFVSNLNENRSTSNNNYLENYSKLPIKNIKTDKNKNIKKFKVTKKDFKKNDKGKLEAQSCCICLNEMKINDECALLKCKHIFHNRCITQWLENKRICPFCRSDIDK
jgi:hypothetical protein